MAEASRTIVAPQFESLEQQQDADELGIWIFLTTEVLFFGGLFAAYCIYRLRYEAAFAAASHLLDVRLGTLNTAVLLTSSLTMALAVHWARESRRRALIGALAATILLGTVFLGIKFYEYYQKYLENLVPFPGLGVAFDPPHPLPEGGQLFFQLYFVMTGLHAVHMIVGIGVLKILLLGAIRGGLTADRSMPVHVTGLYWHFVDIVWVFLFPFLYLIGHADKSGAFLAMQHSGDSLLSIDDRDRSRSREAHPTLRIYFIVFAILLALLALTVAAAEVDLGRLNFLVATLIAGTKATLIILYFMHVRYSSPLTRLFSVAGFLCLSILILLALSDYLTRGWTPFSDAW